MFWKTLMQNINKDAPSKTEKHPESEKNGTVVGGLFMTAMGKSLNDKKKNEGKINKDEKCQS